MVVAAAAETWLPFASVVPGAKLDVLHVSATCASHEPAICAVNRGYLHGTVGMNGGNAMFCVWAIGRRHFQRDKQAPKHNMMRMSEDMACHNVELAESPQRCVNCSLWGSWLHNYTMRNSIP